MKRLENFPKKHYLNCGVAFVIKEFRVKNA